MKTYEEYLSQVNEAIAAIDYPKEPAMLYEPIRYSMSMGGKRVRPVLMLMTCEALGGSAHHALKPALGIEMFHNFTLLHDDVMDNAEMRRGNPTVHRRWGVNTAILSGDAMYTLATDLVAQAPQRCLSKVVNLFARTALEVCEGQQYDVDYERRNMVTEEEYIKMIRLKTSVLLGCACKMGALIAGADDKTADAVYRAGVDLGIAFQLEDDLLDVWGDPKTFGKEIGGDIMNNKKTMLLVQAINRANEDDGYELRRWLTDNYAMRDSKVPAVTAIYERLGVRQYVEEAIDRYNKLAMEEFAKVEMSEEGKTAFAQLAQILSSRKK